MTYLSARYTLAPTLLQALSSLSSVNATSSRSRFAFALLTAKQTLPLPDSVKLPVRPKSSGSGYSPLNDPSPHWSNRPPKETILLDGCGYEQWLIVMEFLDNPKPSEDEMVNTYVKTLAQVFWRRLKRIYTLFPPLHIQVLVPSFQKSFLIKSKSLPGAVWVLPDSYLDVPNKDYRGDLFVDGKVIPRPQYRYYERQPSGSRPWPWHDRHRETMQVERRDPLQRQNWSQGQGGPMQQSTLMNSQNSGSAGENQEMFNRNTA